ncbi:MAG: response regulator, partial [Thermoproteota archaeon]|nr:response regulator [Thermoproteota archaeon]
MTSYSQQYKKQVFESIEKCKPLLHVLKERKNAEQLDNLIQSMITASRLEDHPNIAAFVEHAKNIVEELLLGSIIPNNNVVTILGDAITEIKDTLKTDNEIIGSSLTEKMKGVLKNAKSDERDYVVMKRLRVLYVDEDKFAQYKIKKTVGKSIQIESCFSATEAHERLMHESFDAILCELKLSDGNVLDIFKQYSNKIPIVAISISEDPKVIQMATKAGAMDYIIKNELGTRRIPRSLHGITNEWTKRIKLSNVKRLLNDEYVKTFLKDLISSGSTIREQINSKVTFDVRTDVKGKDLVKMLESLMDAGFVMKYPAELALSCPRCKSIDLINHFLCQNCSTSNFIQSTILEHGKCMHADLENKFQIDDRLICPNCKKDVEPGGEDLRRKLVYECKKCSKTFANPHQVYSCINCKHSNFEISDGDWTQLYNYVLNANKIEEIERNLIPLDTIQHFLREVGFQVNLHHCIETAYATFGPFDLVAQKHGHTVFVIVLGSDLEQNLFRLVELDNVGRAIVAGKVSNYGFILSELREVTLNLLAKFNVRIIIVDNETNMLRKFKETFTSDNVVGASPT